MRREKRAPRAPRAVAERLPFWLAVPWRLHEAYRASKIAGGGSSFLADVLWAQYGLFQCIRLQDDVSDGHTKDLALVHAANLFLVESERALQPHFPRSSRFWRVFWRAFESTTQAIARVDALQRRAGSDPARLGREYARVGAVLKVGTAAVCIGHGRPGDVAPLGRFADECAIADQILDDLEDVDEDLRRGRFNYVAQRIGGRARSVDGARRALVRSLSVGDGAELVFGDARRHFARAIRTAAGLRVPALGALAAGALQSLDARALALHRAQVTLAFGRAHRSGPVVLTGAPTASTLLG